MKRSLRNAVAINCFLATLTACLVGAFALHFERSFWQENLVEDYKNLAVTHLSAEFKALNFATEELAKNAVLTELVHRNSIKHQSVSIESHIQKNNKFSTLVIQNATGQFVYVNTKSETNLINGLKRLHEPHSQMAFTPVQNIGIDFIDGRIFMFASAPIVGESSVRPTGSVTILREVNSELLREVSEKIGRDFSFHYTSAGMRLTQVSYSYGFEVDLHRITNGDDSFNAEYRITLPNGRVQPANFVITFDLKPYQYFDPGYLLFGVVLSVPLITIVLWLGFSTRVITPMAKLIDYVTDEGTYNKARTDKTLSHELPEELKLIHHRFKKVYFNMSRQNQFSQVLVDAIGDIIITVDIEGKICYANPAARQWFNVCESILFGQPLELFTSNINHESPDVATWLYTSNINKERIECKAELVNIISKTYIYPADVIVQPINILSPESAAEHHDGHSSTVVVIRINDTIPIERYIS